jgi:nucleotide-binding universal stress UspA family protein
MTHVLIAADDSITSLAAARAAHRLFGDDARYTVVSVAEDNDVFWGGEALQYGLGYPLAFPAPGAVGGLPYVVPLPDDAQRRVDDDRDPVMAAEQVALDVAEHAGLPAAEVVGERGDAVIAILEAADAHAADVIVVGARDRGWLSRLLAPSVTGAILRESNVPVLVVR